MTIDSTHENDKPMTIAELIEKSFGNSRSKGFWDEHANGPPWRSGPTFTTSCIPEKLMLIVSELSEALEEHRGGRAPTHTYFNPEKPTKPEGIPSELADVMIRVADLAGAFGIDLESAIRAKMAYNASRPHKHGKVC